MKFFKKFFSKTTTEGGGGGGSGIYSTHRPTFTEELYRSIAVISLQHDGEIRSLKCRYYNSPGPMSLHESVHMMSRMIAYSIHGGTRTMFQEGLSLQIEKAINKTIRKYHTEGGE